DLPRIVGATKPDSRVDMEVWRKGKSVKLRVKVGEMPSADEDAQGKKPAAPQVSPVDALGLKVSDVDDEVHEQLGFEGGVQIVEADDPAASAGLTEGDIIVTINDVDITDPKQYAKV